MGCDIHAYVEMKPKKSEYWRGFGARINPGRHYGIFGRLAGVRCDGCLFEPKGIPSDLGSVSSGDYWLIVNDAYKDQEDALRGIAQGCKVKLKSDNTLDRVEHPDWHTPSWLSTDELEKVLNVPEGWRDIEEYQALLAAMRSFETNGMDVRLVFWFDN